VQIWDHFSLFTKLNGEIPAFLTLKGGCVNGDIYTDNTDNRYVIFVFVNSYLHR